MFSPDVHLDLLVFHEISTPQKTKLLVDDWNATMGEWAWKDDTRGDAKEAVFEVEGRTLSCLLHTGTAIEGLSTLTKVGDWMEKRTQFVKGVAFAVVASCNPALVGQENNQIWLWGQNGGGVSAAQISRPLHTVSFKQRIQQTLNINKPYESASILNGVMPTLLQLPVLQGVRGLVWSQRLQDALPADEAPVSPSRKPRM